MKRRIMAALLSAAMLASSVPESAITALASDVLLEEETLAGESDQTVETQPGGSQDITPSPAAETVSEADQAEDLSGDDGLLIEDPGIEVSDSAAEVTETEFVPETQTEQQTESELETPEAGFLDSAEIMTESEEYTEAALPETEGEELLLSEEISEEPEFEWGG